MDYKLRFRGEVDPGVYFWHRKEGHDNLKQPIYVEILEESNLYLKNEANEILEDLYAAHKISPNDAAIFEVDEPTKKHWSRRVHTLERIADRVPVTNRYPAYTDFSLKPHLRHLYEEYRSNRGPLLFLSKDRLYLTKSILEEHFDFGVLVEKELIIACFALHDASYGEDITRSWLLRHWVMPYFYSTGTQCGAPKISHPATESFESCPLIYRPWAQPLMEVRAYFGEKIAFYFAWVGFYGYSLVLPAIIAFICEIYLLVTYGSDESAKFHFDQLILAFFIVYWAARYKIAWDTEEKFCAIKWGTVDFEEQEVDRPQFFGDVDQPRRLSPITYENETFYPEEKRQVTRCFSFFLIILAVGVLLSVIILLFEIQYIVYDAGLRFIAELFPILQSILIQICSQAYTSVATYLNETENYRTETNYENNLIIKKFSFEIFNNYSALAITAYCKNIFFTCTFGSNNCLADTKYLLIAIVATRYAIALYAVMRHGIGTSVSRASNLNKKDDDVMIANPLTENVDLEDDPLETELNELSDAEANMTRQSRNTFAELAGFEAEIELEDYDGTFDDYAEIVLQMGLVCMFTLGWYLLPFFCMLETLLQIRTDAYKLCVQTRRPDPNLAESVDTWSALMGTMGLLACFSSAGIIVWTGRAFENEKLLSKILIFLILQHLMLAITAFIQMGMEGEEPTELKEIRKRQAYVIDRYKNSLMDIDNDGIDDSIDDDVFENDSNKKGHIDRDQLKTSGVKQVQLGEFEKAQIAYLRSRLHECKADKKIAQSEYKRASKAEIFNQQLGVAYSRRNPDLALGMVNLTILEAENIGSRRNPVSARQCRLVVHVRDSTPYNERKYEGMPGPPPTVSKPGKLPPKTVDISSDMLTVGTRIVWNQVFSIAPIKTNKAEIIIEIMDESSRAKLGTAIIVLSDLSSQLLRSLTIPISHTIPTGPTDAVAVMYVKAQFQYSKIIPIKHRIYGIVEEERRLTRDIQNIQLGFPPQHKWQFPEDIRGDENQQDKHDDDDGLPSPGF